MLLATSGLALILANNAFVSVDFESGFIEIGKDFLCVPIPVIILAIAYSIGSIVLIQQILSTYGYELAPLHLALWAIPSAICALLIHSTRLILLDRKLGRRGQ